MKNAMIMIVDDNPKNLQLVGEILNKEGYRVCLVPSGAQALKAAQVVSPDLILLDIMMPEMSGFETCQKLKELTVTSEIPIVFLTAKAETDDLVKGFELGAVDYITKPFNSHELLARVQTHLQLKFALKTVETQRNELEELTHILCHDLSNPLQAIVSGIQIAKTGSRGAKRFQTEEYQDLLLDAALHGVNVIELVRVLRSMESEKSGLMLSPVKLKEALSESIQTLGHRFSEKKIQPIVDVTKEIHFLAEKISFVNSVINNLLTNAIKFSFPDSKVIISAEAEKEKVTVTIRDFGIGMPGDLLEKLFSADREKKRFGTTGESGTGFGMLLVKKFISIYGGEIAVSSKEKSASPDDHGTEVKLTLKAVP